MSKLNVNTIEPQSGTTVTLGASGDTIALASGASVTGNGLVGITVADQWRLSADTNQGTNGTVASNWERVDDSTWSGIGTGLTESSGIFSFNSTGIYLIVYNGTFSVGSGDGNCELEFKTTLDNSNYNEDAIVLCGDGGSSSSGASGVNTFLLDVTNTTNVKFLFRSGSMGGSTVLRGHTNYSYTGFTVLRLGDT
jgi:hypothetical protein